MATIPLNGPEGKAPAKPPISQHPAFPAIVALWFAALLGLGSLVLPVVLLERIVTTTGISALVPAATPPLGFTARGMLALAAALTGAIMGLLLARRLAAGHRPESRSRITDAAHRPLNARLDLGEDGLMTSGVKRRSLAIADEGRQSDFLSQAPLPGEDQWAASVPLSALFDHIPQDAEPLFDSDRPVAMTPLELDGFDQRMDSPEPFDLGLTAEADLQEDDFMTEKQEFHPLSLGQQEELDRQDFMPRPASARATTVAADDLAEDLVEAEPLQFAAPSLSRHEPEAPAFAPAPAPPVIAAEPAPADAADLGMLQLVARLGHSLEKRREQLAQDARQAPEAAPQALPEETPVSAPAAAQAFEAARPEEAAQAMAAFFGKPAGVPVPREATPDFAADLAADLETAFERPGFAIPTGEPRHFASGLAHLSSDEAATDDDGDEDEYLPASFTLPLRNALAAEEPGEDDEDSEFGSLLQLGNPFLQKEPAFVRVDEPEDADALPPAGGVIFPGQGEELPETVADSTPFGADAGARMFDRPSGTANPRKPSPEMDEALRSALSKLQRMSGAA